MANELEAWVEGVEVEDLERRMCDVCPEIDQRLAFAVVKVTVWLGGAGQTIERAVCHGCKAPTVKALQRLVDKTMEEADG